MQLWMVLADVVRQELTQIALTMAVTQQQHPVRIGDGRTEILEVVVVQRCALTLDVSVMAMAQALSAAPQTVGPEIRGLHVITVQPPEPGPTMVEVDQQPLGLLAAHRP